VKRTVSKKRDPKNDLKILILAIVMIGLVVGYYFYLSNKTAVAREENKSLTETEQVLLRNLDTDYPPSPKEVVKYYAQITKCFYDGEYDEEQLEELAKRSRDLLDEELRSNQTEEEYIHNLKLDIEDYKEKELRISSYSTSSSVDVKYSKNEHGDLASLYCLYNIRRGAMLSSSNHEFILRRDDEGHWKILGWTLAEKEPQIESVQQ